MAVGRVADIYDQLKRMAVAFRFRPGERLNEVALARELGVSRTPLREALNRLVAERLVDFRPGAGFFCRDLDPQDIFDLFELRAIVEAAAARLACERAGDDALRALRDDLYSTGLDVTGLTVAQACERDEAFHLGIARLSGNMALLSQLNHLNDRIRYIRWSQMTPDKIRASKAEHRRIMTALMDRDAEAAAQEIGAHIARRLDQVTRAVREGISNIYLGQSDTLPDRVIEPAVEDGA